MKKTISVIIKNTKHELEPIIVARKAYYYNQIKVYTDKLNTPKKDKVMDVFNKYLGINGERINNEVPSLANVIE